ncbi:MAG: succinate dehydrogenase cytochrome b subunit [Bacteroidia bacterium]|jgi:succinate dehydrogenase / fumarate reductase, cytochrome b subunit|nr:succinate dehydrogenase cytochrome b subunit [Sphingobacteriaceae bacterium]MBP9069912.1 succinate dehydrogenase cytochrome b subunit [Bacteroidia bacterium]
MSNSGFLKSSIGKKVIMGATGLFLITFLVVHCFINMLIFFNDGGETFNKGAEFMGTNWLIRATEIILFVGLILHVVQALVLTLENRKARPVPYAKVNGAANSSWYSRSMGLLGTLILMFLIIHLRHFWVESRFTDHIAHNEYEKLAGQETMYHEMLEVFENPIVVLVYVLAMISLAYHLLHGFQSVFQTLGLNHRKYTPLIKKAGIVFSIVISVLFASMPIAMHFGFVK